MKKKKQGFTLIELLAVIVILGLLMAIAIPSVTKYITQSRKKTLTNTISNYMAALTNQVNDMEYIFTASNTIYAVPIECIALERGGTNPFGEWHQASNSYWAYVLVQYDDATSSYTYGFTFKDSAGYGLYPTTTEKLKESGSQINTDLSLTRPTSGSITSITAKENWTGFSIDDNTQLHVLEATSEGETGDGIDTCTLCQKGKNYDVIEQEKRMRLSNLIKEHNTIITTPATLTTTSLASNENGLYVSNATNSGNATYFFRGNVTNNYVNFAGKTWRIVRINEDGSIKLILSQSVYKGFLNSVSNDYSNIYYSNSDIAKPKLDSWYETNIYDKGYDPYVTTGEFCEAAKVKPIAKMTSGNASMSTPTTYIPNFKCSTDGNGKGIVNSKIGLITYDEVVHAGRTFAESFSGANYDGYYLFIYSSVNWTMSPAGKNDEGNGLWVIDDEGYSNTSFQSNRNAGMRPVINLNASVTATGTGTSSDPYVIQTN